MLINFDLLTLFFLNQKMKIFKHNYWLFLLFLLHISCTNKFVLTMNENELNTYFSNKTQKPVFGFANTQYGKMHYAIIGDTSKPLLVFVHGAPGAWYSSVNLISDSTLLQHYCIFTYDRLGFGKSTPWLAKPSISDQANSLYELLKQTSLINKNITLIGRSFGTAISAKFAMLYPKDVEKLILVASCVAPKYEKFFWFSYLAKWALANNFMNYDLQNTTIEKFRHNKQLKIMANDWYKIKAPSYILHGTKDWIAYTYNAQFAFNNITNANTSLYLIDSAGHNLSKSHADLIKEIVLKNE
jgi:pimeloyl-ACP methyl ester carboxylesterase